MLKNPFLKVIFMRMLIFDETKKTHLKVRFSITFSLQFAGFVLPFLPISAEMPISSRAFSY